MRKCRKILDKVCRNFISDLNSKKFKRNFEKIVFESVRIFN